MARKIGDRRSQLRLKFEGEITAQVQFDNVGEKDYVMVEDITANGIQFSSCRQLKAGDRVTLFISDGSKVPLEIVWVKPHYRYAELFCAAGRSLAKKINLIDAFLPEDLPEESAPGSATPVIDLGFGTTGTGKGVRRAE